MTIEEMLSDYWAHHFYDNPKAEQDIEDEEFDLDEVVRSIEENPDEWEPVS